MVEAVTPGHNNAPPGLSIAIAGQHYRDPAAF
jgi:hypothetical protein